MKAMFNRVLSVALVLAMLAVYACGVMVPVMAEEVEGYDLYFKNTDGWDEVYAYYWADDLTGLVSWPGAQTYAVGDDVYGIHVPAEAQYVIFNNNGKGAQTADLTISSTDLIYNQETGEWAPYVGCEHSWKKEVLAEPTCTEDGLLLVTCELCDESYEQKVLRLGHGYRDGICTICGDVKPDFLMIYFENTDGWEEVYAYYWSANDIGMSTWPGEPMVHDGGLVYGIQLPAEAEFVIFNNHGKGVQTSDLEIPGTDRIYSFQDGSWDERVACTHQWQETVLQAATCLETGVVEYRCSQCGESYQEKQAKLKHSYVDGICEGCGEKAPEFRTMYFDNTENWPAVYAYYWNETQQWVQWPGTEMTLEGGSVLSVQVPENAEYIIFSNGTEQTMDMWIPGADYIYTWATASWEEFSGCFHQWEIAQVIWELNCVQGGLNEYECDLCARIYSQYRPPLGHEYENGYCSRCGEVEPEDPFVYFDNAENWETVYIYYWSDKNTEMVTWPGVEMNGAAGGYSAQIPKEAEYVIFNGGSDQEQSPDMWLPGDGYMFCMFSMEWKLFMGCFHTWERIDSENAPTCTDYGFEEYNCTECSASCSKYVAALGHSFENNICVRCGKDATAKITLYFDNAEKWENVYIYFWSGTDIEMTVWPGIEMTAEDGGYYAEISANAEYVIFSNGTSDHQTTDMWIPGDGWIYSIFVDEWAEFEGCYHDWQWKNWTFAPTCVSFGFAEYACVDCGKAFESIVPALNHDYVDGACSRCGFAEPEIYTVYFENTGNWNELYLFYWPDYSMGYDENWFCPSWPGVEMTHVKDNIYSAEVPDYAAFLNFNDGSNNASADLTVPGDGYLYSMEKGEWTKLDLPTLSTTTISGSITSYLNASGEISITLSNEAGVVAQTTVTGNKASYTLEQIQPGTYTLVISKEAHVTRTYTVTVGEDAVTLDLAISPLGDNNGDGKVNVADTGRAYAQVRRGDLMEGYALSCCDMNGDGKININEVAKIYAHVKGTKPLW